MKRLRLFGHPLHPVTVHLPIGLLLAATAFDLIGAVTQPALWADRATVVLIAGLLASVLTVTTGFLDYMAVSKRAEVERAATRHLVVAAAALSVYGVSLWLRLEGQAPIAVLVASVAGAAVLMAAGWLGGQLVYHHGEGVDRGAGDAAEEQG